MKNILLNITILILSTGANAQIRFEQILPLPPAPQIIADFNGVHVSFIDFTDIDGDNDQDVLITGLNNFSGPIAELYTNDGLGNFSLILGTPFNGVYHSSLAFSDVNGDNDQDVLITGYNSLSQSIAELYINNGSGNFSLVSGTLFDGVYYSSIAFSDIDGDNDQDVLITGKNNLGQRIAKLYTNDGSGDFSLVSGTPFDGVYYSSIAFSDIDGDNDQDVLITGDNYLGQRIAKLYTNDGSGNFSLVSGTPFDGVRRGSVAFSDIDGDNDQDVLITGSNSSNQLIAKLYSNDGSGNFSLVSGVSFDGVYYSSIAFSDVDGDSDQDVLITGSNSSGNISKLYHNDGTGNFSLVSGTSFDGVSNGCIAFLDADGDNSQDVLITGKSNSNQPLAELYINDGVGNYNKARRTPFDEVFKSSIAFSDVDGDNDNDVLVTGQNGSNQKIAKLYTNDGLGNFNLVSGTPFDGVYHSSIAFSDVDGDSDQDVLITGKNSSSQPRTKLYTNDGTGNFSLVSGTPFDEVENGSIAFSDIDGDNDQDVLITGKNSSNQSIAKLYSNNGSGIFTLISGTPFEGVQSSSIAFSDIDGDSDQDVLITGYNNSSNQSIVKLYANDGTGNFSLVSGTPFEGVQSSNIAFSDIDGDSDQDVLITGYNSSNQSIAKLYINDGIGNFSLVLGTPFEGVSLGSIAFSDIDGDSDQDVLITGWNSVNRSIAKLYSNDGAGNFNWVSGVSFDGALYSSIAFSDVDGDNDQDVLITGWNKSGQPRAKFYRNTTCFPTTGIDTQSTCNSYIWIDGNTYTTSNYTATHTLTNMGGCDSVVTLYLTINNSNSNTDVQTACDSYTWIDGNIYTASNNIATHILTNIIGCDSIVTLNLTISYSNTSTDTQTACGSYTWIDGSTYATSNNTVTHTLTNINGCDSVVTLDLIINNSNTTDVQIACDSYTWIDGNTYTTSNNTVTHTLSNMYGCDSVVTLDLTINYSNTGTDTQITCDSYIWIDGNTYTTSNNTATHTLANVAGCDSIVTLDLTINYSNTGTDTQITCDSYIWIDGNIYTTSNNTATHTLNNMYGCDSLVTLNLTINTVDNSITTVDPNVTANAVGATYNWLDCNNLYAPIIGEISQVFTATTNGDYAVEVIENGCTDTSTCVTISTVGISNTSEAGLIKLYPNPSNGVFNIDLGTLKNANISIYNTQGKLIYSATKVLTEIYQFELNVESGVYFVDVVSNEEKYHLKLLKE